LPGISAADFPQGKDADVTTTHTENPYPSLTVLINQLVRRVGPYEASRMLAAMIAEQWEAADEHDLVIGQDEPR
jgi:hypothetical protein